MAGARPNFVKLAPLVRAFAAHPEAQCLLVYAGRADDPTLEPSLFDDLQMPRPQFFLDVDSTSLNDITSRVTAQFDTFLDDHPADVVIVVDDLASTMAAAIVAKKRGVRLAHLVAGTRSFDINMPKEINRLVIDALSDFLFTAGVRSTGVASREQSERSQTFMVGNILMDNLRFNHARLKRPLLIPSAAEDGGQEPLPTSAAAEHGGQGVLPTNSTEKHGGHGVLPTSAAAEHGLREPLPLPSTVLDGDYLVFTLNRRALIADTENLTRMLRAMHEAAGGVPIIAPLRDDARRAVSAAAAGLHVVNPLGYLEFGWLTAHAAGVVTDSGNVAEEATFNGVPCITLNNYTEHAETVTVGSNVLVGEDAERLGKAVRDMVSHEWKQCGLPERWDGRTAERIVKILLEH